METCFVCHLKVPPENSFKRYFSTKNSSYYFYSVEKNTSVWALNEYQFNHLCTRCVETICEASWKQHESRTHANQIYYYNHATCQSRSEVPVLSSSSDVLAGLTAVAKSCPETANITLGNRFYHTPQRLCGKRDYFFKGMKSLMTTRPGASTSQQPMLSFDSFQIDDVASFSVTKSEVAVQITQMILDFCQKKGNSAGLSICDGMACVGGNTLSFAQHFSKVVSNEYDYER